ncbi:hypothetical protein AGABI1DRAFT_112912 [Agaricus bisporus var. burnettii JB137-S8]|uniref:Uncharacterized protein n=1 Tax=Agaricus bisporus var. burnettii (strain JB137-S8 / ATCC MYA-4627 / FGSC 10392) TaxID=597362 RepID=K5W365_AGABU|nr:uncharacterized protein AGABI1DRAFT_112912 [Agaricus bisporus var. burnettii JB137-S8]EKM81239.1 hypothetical protein AGABI1DRAFT_112912 [Agaricus bisporus var. burnettii JB137-S8]
MRDRCEIEHTSSHAPEVKAEQTVVNVIGPEQSSCLDEKLLERSFFLSVVPCMRCS